MKMTYSDMVKKYVTGGAAIIYLNKKYGETKYIIPKETTKKAKNKIDGGGKNEEKI